MLRVFSLPLSKDQPALQGKLAEQTLHYYGQVSVGDGFWMSPNPQLFRGVHKSSRRIDRTQADSCAALKRGSIRHYGARLTGLFKGSQQTHAPTPL